MKKILNFILLLGLSAPLLTEFAGAMNSNTSKKSDLRRQRNDDQQADLATFFYTQ